MLCTAPISTVVENCCLQLQGDMRPSLPGATAYCDTSKDEYWSTCVNAQGIANASYVNVVGMGECMKGVSASAALGAPRLRVGGVLLLLLVSSLSVSLSVV